MEDPKKLLHAFVFSRLDYCNALITGLAKKYINRLQLIQNAEARVLTKTGMREHITPVLASLHWFPVAFRIDFKVLSLVFKALHGLAPSYKSNILSDYIPSHSLRSSGAALLNITRMNSKKFGEAVFWFQAPMAWNKFPLQIREATAI